MKISAGNMSFYVALLYLCEGMIGYGMAKAAVHQLVASLSDDKSGLPANTHVAAILPLVSLSTLMLISTLFSASIPGLVKFFKSCQRRTFGNCWRRIFHVLDALSVAGPVTLKYCRYSVEFHF